MDPYTTYTHGHTHTYTYIGGERQGGEYKYRHSFHPHNNKKRNGRYAE